MPVASHQENPAASNEQTTRCESDAVPNCERRIKREKLRMEDNGNAERSVNRNSIDDGVGCTPTDRVAAKTSGKYPVQDIGKYDRRDPNPRMPGTIEDRPNEASKKEQPSKGYDLGDRAV
jgi:hypothetical protein